MAIVQLPLETSEGEEVLSTPSDWQRLFGLQRVFDKGLDEGAQDPQAVIPRSRHTRLSG
jgi:hypothetical protein